MATLDDPTQSEASAKMTFGFKFKFTSSSSVKNRFEFIFQRFDFVANKFKL